MSNEFVVTFKDGNLLDVKCSHENQDAYSHFDQFIDKYRDSVSEMKLLHHHEDMIYALSKNLIDNVSALLIEQIEDALELKDAKSVTVETILRNMEFIKSKFEKCDTRYKRQKEISSRKYFVPTQPKAIGLKWQTKRSASVILPSHGLVQATMQYVSILESLKMLFSIPAFKDMYFKYNDDHVCEPDVYERFCCGNICNKLDLFKNNRRSIQIEISSDDFEVCCPLKSKVGIHKICAVYFQIKNIPDLFKSSINNIFLVCLCNAEYLKSAGGFRNINELIVKELKVLETAGIEINSYEVLKGSLANLSADNLGANAIFGFSESFSSTYYCRHCELNKEECQATVKEVQEKIRDKVIYEKVIAKLGDHTSKDIKKTKGYKRMCEMNTLQNFHILDNWCVDVMHDICEGAIPLLLGELFNHWINTNMLSADEILQRIRDFSYGILDSRNKPSKLNFDKRNLGQNSSQLYCIMIHVPFIFYDIQGEMGDEWEVCASLLQSMTIIFSHKISEATVLNLEVLIEKHLSGIKDVFGKSLTPKQHFLTHYPTYIRRMGPPITSWMMRYESKHQAFTNMAKKTNNFKNLTKSLAVTHQEKVLVPEMFMEPLFTPSKIKSKYVFRSQLEREYFSNHAEVTECKFVNYSNSLFKKGLFISVFSKPYEIEAIVSCGNDFFVICNDYNIVSYSNYFNSVEIEKASQIESVIFTFGVISKITFEKKVCNNTYYLVKQNNDYF